MQASKRILAGLGGLAMIAALTGCASDAYVVRDTSAAQAAQACLDDIESSKKAPQIMTYNSDSKVETHVQTFSDGAAMTVQEHDTNKVTGVDTKVGQRPYSCYADGRGSRGVKHLSKSEASEYIGDSDRDRSKSSRGNQ